jgi:hypothetical protein
MPGTSFVLWREPWLVIDPKPFVGDPAYDATQHLRNCDLRLRSDPDGTIRRFADLLGVDHDRVRLWMFARAAAEPRDNWNDEPLIEPGASISSVEVGCRDRKPACQQGVCERQGDPAQR